ncbi:hypothetical protein OC835_000326 [Tilletia horrida]|nr:hypothetical protein OC835_000326 [Tilletia horrida]
MATRKKALAEHTIDRMLARAGLDASARLQAHQLQDLTKDTAEATHRAHTEAERDQLINRQNLLLAQASPQNWRSHLIAHASAWRFEAGSRFISVSRDEAAAGLAFFDQYRRDTIGIRSPSSFAVYLRKRTKGVLDGVDFQNLVIAGGFPLACLLCTDQGAPIFHASDIDLYLFAVTSQQASDKASDIQAAIQANVDSFDEHYYVVRTSGTLSFVPKPSSTYPKIQIVLRLHYSALDVVANFDRDEVSLLWDGSQVLLDLRAVRAINSGFSVLTEKLIKSTSMTRIINRYAQRGFGLISRAHGATPTEIAKVKREATAAYDWIAARLKENRTKTLPWTPPHRAINMHKVIDAVQERVGSLWLASFRAFAHAAALWDHVCVWCDDFGLFFRDVNPTLRFAMEQGYDE